MEVPVIILDRVCMAFRGSTIKIRHFKERSPFLQNPVNLGGNFVQYPQRGHILKKKHRKILTFK